MAENEPPAEPPTPPTGMPALPAGPSQPVLPPGLSADEYRRFQEFQRFQDYQRFVESGQSVQPNQPGRPGRPADVVPQPSQQPGHELATQLSDMRRALDRIERVTNPPTWQKVLRNKWLHRMAWLAVLIALATWGVPTLIHHYFGTNDTGTGSDALPLPPGQSGILVGPHDTIADVYRSIDENSPTTACFVFSATAAKQFAKAAGAADCPKAIAVLSGKVINKAAYADPVLTDLPSPQGDTMTISSCSFAISGGPRLGTFTLTKQDKGWLITGYAGPAPCPSASTPPTS